MADSNPWSESSSIHNQYKPDTDKEKMNSLLIKIKKHSKAIDDLVFEVELLLGKHINNQ